MNTDNIDNIVKETLTNNKNNNHTEYTEDINKIISKVNSLNLRTKIGREEFNKIINDIVSDPNLIYSLFIQEEKLKNDAKYLKEVGNLLLEEKRLDEGVLKQQKIIKKSYSKSGYYIKPREEEYIIKGFSLNATDLPTNIDNLYAYGLFDGVLKKYIVTKEHLTQFPIQNFIREIKYTKEPLRNSLSLWAIKDIGEQTLSSGNIMNYYNNPNLFINTALQIKNNLSAINKINSILENLIKYIITYNILNLKKRGTTNAMKILSTYEKLNDLIEKKNLKDIGKKLGNYIKISNLKQDTYKPHEFTNFYIEMDLGNNKIYSSYKELLGKDVILQDLRNKTSKLNLISFIEYVKNIIANSQSAVFKPQYNILARKIVDKEYIENDKYKKIIKEVNKFEINLS